MRYLEVAQNVLPAFSYANLLITTGICAAEEG